MAQPDALQTSLRPRVWLVTGCSSGLGRHLVCAVLDRGDRIIATARRISDLDYINSREGGVERAYCITLDVTAPSEQIQAQIKKAMDHFGHIDVLVNNAGFVLSGVWEELSDQDTYRQLETNLFGTLKVTRSILPYMRSARSGVILFMGSIAGWHGVGAGGPYSVSKFAIEGAAECLSKETAHLGIRTHVLVLGQFRTHILNQDRKAGTLSPTELSEYDAIKAELADRHKETHGEQPGDPKLAAERVVDIARLENLSEEEKADLSLRIPLGSDALEIMQSKCVQTLGHLQTWGNFAKSTDYKDAQAVPSYLR